LPRLYYVSDEVDAEDPHYEVYLPPYSALFTSSEVLFRGLGFSGRDPDPYSGQRGKSMPPIEFTADIGGRQRPVVTTLCYGYVNDNQDPANFRGDKMSGGESFRSMLGIRTVVPDSIQLQMQFLKMDFQWVQTSKLFPTTTESAVLALNVIFEDVARVCNLKHNLMEATVNKTNPSQVLVRNRAMETSKVTLWFRFDAQTAPVFDVSTLTLAAFPLALSRTVTFEMMGGKQDPLKGKGPVTVVAHGYGDAKSWIEGRGYVTVVGVYDDRKQTFYSVDLGLPFQTDQTVLTLEFLDSTSDPIKFTHDVHAHLILNFSRV
jgi:hypothetical protein